MYMADKNAPRFLACAKKIFFSGFFQRQYSSEKAIN